MPRIIHFEIHADDVPRAIAFYKATFAWEFNHFGGPMDYWLIVTGPDSEPGINGGMLKRPAPNAGHAIQAYICTVDVPDVEAFVNKVLAAGGTVAKPKMVVPRVGYLAYCMDTEGNVFGMMQRDPTASQ